MIEFGKTLREAREAKGYTVSQIAEMTRMIHQVVEDLEQENFSRIAAPIYGRGFVKLYCEAVGIDHKALVDEFMDIYNGKRELGIKERVAKAPPAQPPQAEPVQAPPPVAPLLNERRNRETVFEDFPPSPAPHTERPGLQPAATVENEKFARYASPLREMNVPSFSVPPAVWRIASLAVAALVILYFAFAGLKALYRATTAPAEETPATTEEATAPDNEKDSAPSRAGESAGAGEAANAARTPVKVKSLYID